MHFGIQNIFFILCLIAAAVYFGRNFKKLYRNINLGKDLNRTDNPGKRWKTMARVALGQGKMTRRLMPGLLHIVVYVGFVLSQLELVEIFVDGIFGTHRAFHNLGWLYDFVIGLVEFMVFLVLVSCIIFLIRRVILKVKRLTMPEMEGWPHNDAIYILIMEILFMTALLIMNGSDQVLQARNVEHFVTAGSFPISSWLTAPWLAGFSSEVLILVERSTWWFHILGVFFFLNYLYYSKHLHILLAFPSTWFSNLNPKGQFNNLEAVTKEVKMMMDPSADPFAADPEGETPAEPSSFGAKDIFDLNKVQLLNAYTCTECGRCTSDCPANITGKKLSPRKIMMSTRDRLEEVSKNIDANGGEFKADGKNLLHDYISAEELWACTSCNACTESCPINLDPLSIIIELRRFMVMENSEAPMELNLMMTNLENNGAPWQFNQADKLNWATED